MKSIQCIIVDDEPLARELIHTYVRGLKDWEVVAICKNPTEAYEALYQHDIDIIFLDIQMPVVSGIDFLRTLRHPPQVIFTTAHPEHAVNAFELKAVDYLLKPITEERFLQAIEKVRSPSLPDEKPATPPDSDAIFLRQESKLVKIMFTDILYVEALKDFCRVFTKQGSLLVSTHLKQMEEMLPASKFVRIHRSYMISLNAISALQGNTVEINKLVLPVGGIYKEDLLKKLKLS